MSFVEYKNTDCTGNNISSIQNASITADSCKSECANNSLCTGAVFQHNDVNNQPICNLKYYTPQSSYTTLNNVDLYVKQPVPILPDPNLTGNPNGTSKDFYNMYKNTTIDPTSDDSITYATVGLYNNKSTYNVANDGSVGHDVAVAATINYQKDLEDQVKNRETLNKDINDNLHYSMMAMTIWVPLGIFAGYYLYSKNK